MSVNPVEHRCLFPVGPAGQKRRQTQGKTENADPVGTGLQNVSSCFWPDGNSSSVQSKAYLRAIRTSQKMWRPRLL